MLPPLTQDPVEVLPTRSIYEFEDAGVHVTLTFMSRRCRMIWTCFRGR